MAKGCKNMQKVFWIKKVTVVAFYTPDGLHHTNTSTTFTRDVSPSKKRGDSCIVLDGTIYASPLDLDQSPILFHQTSVKNNMLQVELRNLAVLQMEAFL